jgi:hypothetical protein
MSTGFRWAAAPALRRLAPAVWLAVVLSLVTSARAVHAAVTVTGNPHTPLAITLALDALPVAGQLSRATVTILSRGIAAPGTLARLVVPSGMEQTGGPNAWSGDLAADVPVSFTAELRLTRPGNVELRAIARRGAPDGDVWADAASLTFHAGDTGAQPGWQYGKTPAAAVPAIASPQAMAASLSGVAAVQEEEFALLTPAALAAPRPPPTMPRHAARRSRSMPLSPPRRPAT